jgi:hypothetical protein
VPDRDPITTRFVSNAQQKVVALLASCLFNAAPCCFRGGANINGADRDIEPHLTRKRSHEVGIVFRLLAPQHMIEVRNVKTALGCRLL